MAEKCFHFFPRLPTELRLEVWRLCLPCRISEVDYPTDEGLFEPGADGFYPCNVMSTAKLNGLPPVITRVCQESRMIARESGSVIPDGFYADLPDDDDWLSATNYRIVDKFWIDIKRDSAHLNWYPLYESLYENSSGSALAFLAWQSCQLVGRPSIMGDWFTMRCNQKEERFDVFEKIPSWWVIMRVVIIHARFRDAAQSGLFGLLGDASVQIVSVSDEQTINAFYDFATKYDRQMSSVRRFRFIKLSLRTLKQELKKNVTNTMNSENLLSKMHPAIMFRLCATRCSRRKELSREGLLSF